MIPAKKDTMRQLFVAFLFAAVAQAQAPQWVQSPLNGHYYALTSVCSWSAAESAAQAYGGHLATVRSAAENAWLVGTFVNGAECLWIGLNDQATEGAFDWASGEPVGYTNWNFGEPNGGTIENVVHLCLPWGAGTADSTWNDAPNISSPWGVPSRGIMEVSALLVADYAPFGIGCLGPTNMTPLLASVAGETPRIGSTSHIRVSNLPTGVINVPVFVIGFSNSFDTGPAGQYPLPLDLGILGWPGCNQYVSLNDTVYYITTTGTADHAVTIPPFPFLAGMSFYAQVLALYHPTGAAVSNGLIGTVGY